MKHKFYHANLLYYNLKFKNKEIYVIFFKLASFLDT